MYSKLRRREPHRLIRIREVLRKVGVSQSTWYEDGASRARGVGAVLEEEKSRA